MSSKNILSKASTRKIKIKTSNSTSISSGIETNIIKSKRQPKYVAPSAKNIKKITEGLSSVKLGSPIIEKPLFYPGGNLDLKINEKDTLTKLHYGIVPIYLNFGQAQKNFEKTQYSQDFSKTQVLTTWFLIKSIQTYQIDIFPSDSNFQLANYLEEYYEIPFEMVLEVSEIQPLLHLKVFLVYLHPSFMLPPISMKPYIDPTLKKEWRYMIDMYNQHPKYYANANANANANYKTDMKNPYIAIMNCGFTPAHQGINIETVNENELKQKFSLLLLYQDLINQYSHLSTKI